MKAVVEFLRQLHAHNERAWFEAHRAEWLQLQERVRSFAEGLIEGIASFDPSVEGLTAKDCTYRIYRDVRFSRDKSPYKTWQGIYVAPHGKKAGYAGYYFLIKRLSRIQRRRTDKVNSNVLYFHNLIILV